MGKKTKNKIKTNNEVKTEIDKCCKRLEERNEIMLKRLEDSLTKRYEEEDKQNNADKCRNAIIGNIVIVISVLLSMLFFMLSFCLTDISVVAYKNLVNVIRILSASLLILFLTCGFIQYKSLK